jgi:hypothetical protein
MFYDHSLMISALTVLLPVTTVVSASFPSLGPRISLPRNVPYVHRDNSNGTGVLNNITSNITSGSEQFLWVIQDTYDASNFFQ